MKKKITALFLALLTIICTFSFSACRGKKDDDKDDENKGQHELPDPEPVDGLTLIAGNWNVSDLQIMQDESGTAPSVSTDTYRLEIRDNGAFNFSRYTEEKGDEVFEGKAENDIALNYYKFSCTMGEITVTADAYLYPDGNTLHFSSIVFEGYDPEYNYTACTCVRGV